MFLSLDVQTQQRKHITKCTKVQRRGQSRSVSPVMPPSSGNSISFVVRHWWPLTDQRAAGCHGDAAPFLTHWQKAGLTYSAHFIVFYPHCIVFFFFFYTDRNTSCQVRIIWEVCVIVSVLNLTVALCHHDYHHIQTLWALIMLCWVTLKHSYFREVLFVFITLLSFTFLSKYFL